MKKFLSLLLTALLSFGVFTIIPVYAADEAQVLTPWDGITAEKPIGEGTVSDPYLISSGSHLLWMSQQVGSGSAPEAVSDPFADAYFKQISDIDLGGKTFKSIGYYFASTAKYFAFGGTFDGQGYTIKNGVFVCANPAHDINYRWGSGLFGVVYGATIRNIKFDNITATDKNIVGVVAGRVVSTSDSPDGTFNLIENIVISNTCSVVATSQPFESGNVGGIAGCFENGKIINCINNAEIEVYGNKSGGGSGGGIVGSAGENSTIENCINNGNVIVNAADSYKFSAEGYFGGIAGSNYAVTNTDGHYCSSLTIKNSYNTGSLTCTDTLNTTIAFGGIFGATIVNADSTGTFNINNCYNLSESNTVSTGSTQYRISGIVGCSWAGGGPDSECNYLNDCYSVDIITNGGRQNITAGYTATNEYIVSNNTLKNGSKSLVAENCSTKTVAEIQVFTDVIDTDVETAINNGVTSVPEITDGVQFIGTQETEIQDEKYGVRFVATVDKLDYDEVGFEISATFSEGDKLTAQYDRNCAYVYNTLTGKDSQGVKSYTAANLGGNYIMALSIINIPTSTGIATFTVKAYTEKDNVKTYGDIYTIVYTNGVFTSIVKA